MLHVLFRLIVSLVPKVPTTKLQGAGLYHIRKAMVPQPSAPSSFVVWKPGKEVSYM